jgi:hypothetical protein
MIVRCILPRDDWTASQRPIDRPQNRLEVAFDAMTTHPFVVECRNVYAFIE